MIVFRPFDPEHLAALQLLPEQAALQARISEFSLGAHLVQGGFSYSGFVEGDDGELCVGCAGVLPQWPGRALAWAIFGCIPKRCWPAVVARTRRVLDRARRRGFRRIEAHVDAEFAQAIRLAAILGFAEESTMPLFTPDGRTSLMYVRLNHG